MTTVSGDRAAWKTYRPLVVLSVAAVGGAGLLQLSGSQAFLPYFRSFNPVGATAAVLLLGAGALFYLQSRGWFVVRGANHSARQFVLGISAAAAFALPVIAIDFLGAFPRNLDVPAPQSFIFYPVIALVAECAFHAVPLALMLLLAKPLVARLGRPRTKWSCIVLASLIEPILQSIWASPETPGWATAYVAAHVFAINLTILYLFARFDFLTAYGFRALYYLLWHIAWGAARIPILFEG